MTKEDVKQLLEANGAVKVTYADPQPNAGAEVHRIWYRVPISADVDSEPKHFDLVKQDDGTYKYQKEIPDILRESPASPRDFHYSDADIKTGLESLNPGWTVLRVNQSRDGEFDRATVIANNGSEAVTKTYLVWDKGDGTKDYKEIA